MIFRLLTPAVLLVIFGCAQAGSSEPSIQIEAETGFENIDGSPFTTEANDIYSGGATVMLTGETEPGESGTAQYALAGRVPQGKYTLVVHYNDENDGHSPVSIRIDDQRFDFVMNASTPAAFPDIANKRSVMFEDVVVTETSTLELTGTVDRYESEHKELVRIDVFEFLRSG